MDTGKQHLEGSGAIVPESGMARLRLDIEQYERLLQTGLKPRAREMFEHLLARVKAELAVIEAEETASQALLTPRIGVALSAR
jgi:hypothetical protein